MDIRYRQRTLLDPITLSIHVGNMHVCVCIQKRGKTQGKTLGGPIDPLGGPTIRDTDS